MLAEAERHSAPLRIQIRPPLTLEVGRVGEHSYSITFEPGQAIALAHQLLAGAMAVENGAREATAELEAITGKGRPPC